MTHGPIILTLDCDMYSNDPSTPKRASCYFLDQSLWPNLAFVQTPQRFHGLNWADIYANEFKALTQANPMGMDGLCGPNHMGTGCFFRRRAFFGGPSSFVQQEMIQDHVVNKPIKAQTILEQAHQVASCNYENQTNWGFKVCCTSHSSFLFHRKTDLEFELYKFESRFYYKSSDLLDLKLIIVLV